MTAAALALALALAADRPVDRLAAANALLAAGDAAGAERGYTALLADGLESPALHVNRGAALLRLGRAGAAVASWQRALRLDPADGAVRAALATLRARAGDRLAPEPEPPLLERLGARVPARAAAAAFLAPWALLWALVAVRRRARAGLRAPLGAALAACALAAAAGAALVAASEAERRAARAVVTAAEAPLRDGPEAVLRPARVLREGAVLRVVEDRGEALRVRLDGAREGWVRAEDVERI